jgi:hypothetical protein
MMRSPDKKDDEPVAATPAAEGTPAAEQPKVVIEQPKRKFHNGWTRQLEILVSEWADKAACYRWMHEKTEARYNGYNMWFTIPVIILSTLTGTANFGVNDLLPDPSMRKFSSAAIGGVSIFAGIITTIANFLRYAQGSEAHKVAGVSWGKFQRFISTELALHPNERMDAMSFLKMGRVELDRLIEQSPTIPPAVIKMFEHEFKNKTDIKRPEIAGGIEHTKFFDDRDSRLAKIVTEASFLLQQKKGLMKQLIIDDFDKHIAARTRAERAQLENELMGEVLRVARETAVTTVASKMPKVLITTNGSTTSSSATGSQRTPPRIPPNTVNRARSHFERRGSTAIPDAKQMADLAKQAAQEAIARRSAPDTIHLDIVADDDMPAEPVNEIK